MQFLRRGYLFAQNSYDWIVRSLTLLIEGKSKKSLIAPLDGVRAIACLVVVAYHLSLITTHDLKLWYPDKLPSLFSTLAFSGDSGVNLFFVLSGFLLFMPYAKALLFEHEWPSARTFYIRRALRILPLYYVSLFLMILLYRPDFLQPNRLGDLFMFLILFMDSSPTAFKQINGPFWTLAVEWQFYLLLPLLALGIGFIVRKGSLRRRLYTLFACLAAVMVFGILTRSMGVYLTLHPGSTLHLPRPVINVALFFLYGIPTSGLHGKYLEDFAVGMLASTLYIFGRSTSSSNAFNIRIRTLSPVIFAGGLLWLLVTFMWKYNQNNPHTWPLFDNLYNVYLCLGEFALGIGYGLCVLAILFGADWLKRPFEWRPLRWLGILSYGLYTWHLLLLETFTDLVIRNIHGWRGLELYGLYWVWVLAFILPCVLLLFVFVEKPWLRVSDALTRTDKGRKSNQQPPQPVQQQSLEFTKAGK